MVNWVAKQRFTPDEARSRAFSRGYATTGEAAALLNKCAVTIRHWIKRGKIQSVHIGARHYVALGALEERGISFPKRTEQIDSSDGDNYEYDY